MGEIYNWGIFPKINAEQVALDDYLQIAEYVRDTDVLIARGNGRCYGDSSLQKKIFSTLSLNKLDFFDTTNGIIKCQAGLLLDDILKTIVPHGFFLPVAPGTKFITIGGAVASNIHGKNHHKEGAISAYIKSLELMVDTGAILHCSTASNSALFTNTIGGMGLTGIILSVTLQLKKIETSYMKLKTVKARNLEEVLDSLIRHNDYLYSVAWIDCLSKGKNSGRSLLLLAEHARINELNHPMKYPLGLHSSKQFNIPVMLPSFVLNNFSVRLFNSIYFHKQRQYNKERLIHYNAYFFSLDALNNWNRIYGNTGFTQYQFVIPFENGREGLSRILKKISDSGCTPFLSVLKAFGEKDKHSSELSFPMKGYSLALDFKIAKKTFLLLDELDEIIVEYGGRLYLTKDARMSKETFQKTYHSKFIHANKFNSLQSERLEI